MKVHSHHAVSPAPSAHPEQLAKRLLASDERKAINLTGETFAAKHGITAKAYRSVAERAVREQLAFLGLDSAEDIEPDDDQTYIQEEPDIALVMKNGKAIGALLQWSGTDGIESMQVTAVYDATSRRLIALATDESANGGTTFELL